MTWRARCITLDPVVYYAYEIVADPSKLTVGDALILHALGVKRGGRGCQADCKTKEIRQSCVQS